MSYKIFFVMKSFCQLFIEYDYVLKKTVSKNEKSLEQLNFGSAL